jgi:hypothetical protein
MAAIIAELALSFAGVESASLDPSAAAERANAETLMADFARTAPFEYSPGDYQSRGREN